MSTEILPTAEGDLGRTPFAHLLVYAADQQLTGALFLHVPDGVMHSVRLECGRPVKIQMGDGFARLGQLMVDAGILDLKTLDLPRSAPGLIGESLVVGGHITRDILDKMVERQFFMRMARLFGLPPATRYVYFADMHEIIDDGAPTSLVHPLAVIWAGLREHAAASVMMASVLERIGKTPLRLHRLAGIERLRLTLPEREVLAQLRETPQTLRELVETNPADEPSLRRMVYALVILRFFDFGNDALPLFPEKATLPPTSSSSVNLARIQLQQTTARRFVGAAPDDVGDGERIRPQPRLRKRARSSKSGTASVPPPAASNMAQMPKVTAPPAPTIVTTSKGLDDQTSDNESPPSIPTPSPSQTGTPRPAQEMYELSLKRLAEKDRQGALAACELARSIDPDQPDYVVLATWIRAVTGGCNLEECVHDLDKVLETRPNHVPALFYRGYLRRRTGDEPGARADLQRVLELEPDHQDALRELHRLERRSPARRPSGLYQA